MTWMSRALTRICWLLASAIAWLIVYELIAVRDVGAQTDFWATDRLIAYGAFVLAPAITFMPIAHKLRIPLYDLEAIIAWSTLAFTFTFVDPGANPPMWMLLVFLVSLVMSLATVLTLLSYATGLRIFARRSQRYDFVRARREGYLGSIFCVGLLLLSFLNVLSIITAALMGMIVLLLEIFLLSRGGQLKRPRRAQERPLLRVSDDRL
jgi:hypothetical protein